MTTTPHVLATGDFLQDWTNTGLITANDSWAGVGSIVGYLGDISPASTTNVDPRTLTGADLGALDVLANQTSPNTVTNGGVGEFQIADPTIALNGSGTADAPSLVLYMDATGRSDVVLSFDARDIDASNDDATQQIAVQYRIGGGTWTNVPGGYDADVTTQGSATEVTPFHLTLPSEVNGQAGLQIRILTTNAGGNDEWVGIDNIRVASQPATPTGGQSVGFAPGSLAVSVDEGDSGVTELTFVVERTGGTDGEINFAGTITSSDADGADFSEGTLPEVFGGIIPAGETSATVTIRIAGDTAIEPDEHLTLTLTAVGNSDETIDTSLNSAASEATGTIVNDEVEITKISAIQGEGEASSMVGQTVTIEAIVVGDFQDGDADGSRDLGGFYVQEEGADSDGNALTSEGIFVFGGNADVHVGDRVRITATVSEYFGMTELTPTSVTIVEAGAVADVNEMAAVIELPAQDATLNQNGQYQPDLEAYEGMLVTIPETLTISEQFNLDRFNEIKLVAGERAAQFTHDHAPDAAGYLEHLQQLGSRTITYDDGLNIQNAPITNLDGFGPSYDTASAPRMGDTITGLTGVLDYQWAGNSASGSTWRVRSIEDGANAFDAAEPRPAEPADVGGRLQVGSFNVLNYFTTLNTLNDSSSDQPGDNTAIGLDPRGANDAAEFARQTDKLVSTLIALDADVLALIEIENDFLPGSDGNAIEYLVGQINARLGSETYAWVDPGQQFVGGDAIAVGFIYKPDVVTVSLDTTIEILDDADLPALGLDGLIDQSTVDGVFNGLNTSRAALAVTFEEVSTGEEFTAIANHLKSKSGTGTGADADQLDGQGAWQQQRELAGHALTSWAASDPTHSGDSDVLLLGDFNAYFQEDVISGIEGAGYENLQERLDNPYSYVFDGQTGSLDYIFASNSLASQVTGVTEWHINADEADALDYNTDFGRDPAIFDGDAPVRVSDHDPLLIGLDLAEEPAPANFKLQILHASDFEAGLDAIDRAKYFGAIVDYLEDTEENSITLSSGDNYLPSPFFNAGGDPAMKEALETALEDYYDLAPGTLNLSPSVGRPDVAILNMLGIQASAIGNHEYDAGTREFQNIIGRTNSIINPDAAGWIGTQFPYLSANTDFSGDPNLNPLYTSEIRDAASYNIDPTDVIAGSPTGLSAKKIAPATIIEENGEKIGVVGATTQIVQSISSTGGIEIIGDNVDDMPQLAEILQPTIDALLAQGIDKIILVSHLQQLALEKALAPLLHGVDIIIAGGSHTLLADETDDLLPGDTAVDTYPLVTTNADGKPLAIVNTANEYSYVGRLVVEFDANGDLIAESIDPNVSGAYAANQETVDELYANPLDIDGDGTVDTAFEEGSRGDLIGDVTGAIDGIITAQDGNIFGRSDVYLEGRREEVRQQETNLGDLSADANLWYAKQVDGTVLISIKNGGGIRDSIGRVEAVGDVSEELPPAGNPDAGKDEGEISQLDIANSLRFNNALSLVTVTAAQLLLVLEHAVAATTATATPGQFAQIGGIAFSFDDDLPAGERVVSAALIDENGQPTMALVENGELVVDPEQAFRLVTLSFLLTGGDSYPFASFIAANPEFANVVNLTPELVPDEGQLANFVAEGTEQDAFAEYLAAFYADEAYDTVDTDRTGDTRIQNLDFRDDTVLEATPVVFNGTAADDVVEGAMADDSLSGNAGDDTLSGNGGDDLVRGGGGDDTLDGGAGNDTLLGGAGDDRVTGGAGNDVIEGGRGDDLLAGGDGSDSYSYEEGDGSDTIEEGAGQSGDADSLVFQDVDAASVVLRRTGNDIEIVLADGDVVTLKNQFDGTGGVEEIAFADGTTLDRAAIIAGLENRDPTAANDMLDAVLEDADAFLVPFAALLGNDGDADGDALTVTGVGPLLVGCSVEVTEDGLLVKPNLNFNGEAFFTYLVSDGRGGTASARASFTVTAVQDAPGVTAPAPVTLDEDTVASGTIIASDADGDTLTYAIKGDGPAHGAVTVGANGAWTYTADADYHGADSFTVLVNDGTDTVEAVVDLTVAPVNDGPVAVDDAGAAGENETKLFDLTANDTDVEDGAPTLTGFSVTGVDGLPLSNEDAAAAFSIENGQLKFVPGAIFDGLDEGESATVSLSYTVEDADGAEATASFTLTVSGRNEANIIVGTNGINVLFGTNGTDVVDARGGADVVFGRGGDDVIDGGDGSDILFAGDGSDVLDGGEGTDTLFGGDGDDRLSGGAGNDLLTGEDGADAFVFKPGFGRDIVLDFRAAEGDVIELDASVFADFAALQADGALTGSALGAVVTYDDGSTLLLTGVSAASLNADDFRFV